MKKIFALLMICCLLVVVSVCSSSCKKKVVQAPTTTEKSTSNIASEEPESIKALQVIALKNFDEQMQTIFAESPDKDKKIEIFEASMTALAQEYYRYYVEETKQGIEVAKEKFTAYLKDFKSPDGVGLSKDSTPYYLERVKAK
jgi:peptidoglycan hydrolase CwlO-like protein